MVNFLENFYALKYVNSLICNYKFWVIGKL